jgi:protein-disulfide isomerase
MRLTAAAACAFGLCVFAQTPARPPAARPPAAAKSALNKANLEAYLRKLELWPAQVQVQIGDPKPFIRGLLEVNVHLSAGAASKDVPVYVSADGKTIIRGTAYNIDRNPFQTEIDLLSAEYQPSFGPANAPLTLVVFSDFECPVCREEAKQLRQKAPADVPKDVRVVFNDFPLDSIHPRARTAAIAGRCVYRQNAAVFWDYHDWIYEHQLEINAGNLRPNVLDWAKARRLDATAFERCIDGRLTESEVDAEVARGKKLQVDSTPTQFLNGRRLVGQIPWPSLLQIIQLELDLQKANR